MVFGSVTITAYLVIGATSLTMSSSWSPSWRSGRGVLRTVVSNLTCPDTTIMPIESVQAPQTPVIAFVPPGPVVTLTAARRFVSRP